ncbi:hypothetical protein KKF81_04735 [Candidatus Micrarchaeota archaeon]|nr:hypothetical protein [Candidatus Micrarchaeota archaeon]
MEPRKLRHDPQQGEENRTTDRPAVKRTTAFRRLAMTAAVVGMLSTGCGAQAPADPEQMCEIDDHTCLGPGPTMPGSTNSTIVMADESGNINEMVRAGNIAARVICINISSAEFYVDTPKMSVWIAPVEGCTADNENRSRGVILTALGEEIMISGDRSGETGTLKIVGIEFTGEGAEVTVNLVHNANGATCATSYSPCLGNQGTDENCSTDGRSGILLGEEGEPLHAGPMAVRIYLEGTTLRVKIIEGCDFGEMVERDGFESVEIGQELRFETADGIGILEYNALIMNAAGTRVDVSLTHECSD